MIAINAARKTKLAVKFMTVMMRPGKKWKAPGWPFYAN